MSMQHHQPTRQTPPVQPTTAAGAVVLVSLVLMASPVAAWGVPNHAAPNYQANNVLPIQEQNVGIDDHAGQAIPKGLTFKDETGKTVAFDSLFNHKQPVVVVLAYYTCPMLCTLVIGNMISGLKGVPWTIGNQFRTVIVSFDPRDTPKVAEEQRTKYLKAYGRPLGPDTLHFLTADNDNTKKLADALGFRYHWDQGTKTYAHAAGAFILTPDERISRTFYGISFPSSDLRLALIEASKGASRSATDRILLYCFHFDSKTGKYTLAVTRVMTAGGAIMVLIVGALLTFLWRREKRQPPIAQS